MKGLFITYTCSLSFSVLTGHCYAAAKVLNMVLSVQNPAEPYGCNTPVKEFRAAHDEDTSGQHDMALQNYTFKNPPQGKLITLFNPQRRKIGCIVNRDLSAKEYKVVVMAQNYPACLAGSQPILSKRRYEFL